MRKLLVAIVFFGLSFSNVVAQKVQFGVKAGVNFASIHENIDSPNPRISFSAGAFAQVSLSKKFTIQPELIFSEQGAHHKLEHRTTTYFLSEEKIKLDYIAVPLIAKIYPASRFALEIGPQVAYLINAISKSSINGNTVEEVELDVINDIDFGINFGFS